MTFEEWCEGVPKEIRNDAVWKFEVYRMALFASDIAWSDVTKLVADRRTVSMGDQLQRAVGAISSDICEGFSRRSGRDQARFYEYGLGSAREARDWYFKGRHILGEAVTRHRIELLTGIIKSLLTIIPNERATSLRDEPVEYRIIPPDLLDHPPQPAP